LLQIVHSRSVPLTAALKTKQNLTSPGDGKVAIKISCNIFVNKYFESAHSEGIFRSACGQQYFFSNGPKTFAGALEECCKYGLKLLSVESANELSCIFEMNQSCTFNLMKIEFI
jgi:hypothetical protein